MYQYTIELLASQEQGDAGKVRESIVIAYCATQAWAWAKRDHAPYATPIRIVASREYNAVH